MVRLPLKILCKILIVFVRYTIKAESIRPQALFLLEKLDIKYVILEICYTFFKPYIFCYIENRNELVTATTNLRNFVERLFYEFREGFKTKVTVVFILGFQQNFIYMSPKKQEYTINI